MKLFLIKALLFLSLFFSVERFCHKKTHGFRPYKIQSTLPYNPEWEIPLSSKTQLDQIKNILSQPFFFLNSGGECYAFVSKDNKYVLKFFKHHHMREKSWADWLPIPSSILKRHRQSCIKKLNILFTSCKLANHRFKEETGIVYLHLNKTDFLDIQIKLFDAIGALHNLPLDQLEFALQKRAVLAYPTLTYLVEIQEIEAAKTRLTSLVDLIKARSQAGIADHDPRKRNFGFIGEKAIEIDLGSFSQDDSLKSPKIAKRKFTSEITKLRRWVHKNHPELDPFLDKKIKDCYHELNVANVEVTSG